MLISQGLNSDSIVDRTAIVGLILLGATALVTVGMIVAGTVAAIDRGWELLDEWRQRHRNIYLGWILFAIGVGLLALAYIFSNIGVGLAGGFVLFFLWRMNVNSTI